MVVPQTNFTIQGTNTNVLTAAIAIQSGIALTSINPNTGAAAGGTGVTLTGTGLTGATAITFDGISATSVNVVNSTTVTAVTPAHAAGAVDVVIDTPPGGVTLVNGYTYVTTAVGQPSSGGTIACLNGGLNNLIAATADNSTDIQWGGHGTAVGITAQSITDGATNTAAIVNCLTNGVGAPDCIGSHISIDTYAAGICSTYAVDSQGNTPCEPGNACYNDWFLPSGSTGQLNCLFANRVTIGGFNLYTSYWSSTEYSSNPNVGAWSQNFISGSTGGSGKFISSVPIRCVRSFAP